MTLNPAGRFLANTMLEPLHQPIPKTPHDYGMSYRDVAFTTRDGVTLRGWLVNETAPKVIVITHFGYRANRYGYQVKYQPKTSKPYDHEIEFGYVAKRLVDAGYAVLMYDLRNHGESDRDELGVGTGGIGERFDVIAAVEFLANDPATAAKPIGLLSYCYGTNTSFCAMQEDSQIFRDAGVKAMVALQPLRNGDYLKAMKIPGFIYRSADRHYRAHTGGISLLPPIEEAAKSVCVPTRLVQARKDPMTNLAWVAEVFDNMPVEKEMFWLEEPTHRFDGYNWFADHPQDMLSWFDKYV